MCPEQQGKIVWDYKQENKNNKASPRLFHVQVISRSSAEKQQISDFRATRTKKI